ncbi:uncharacterized protein [Dendropsophus ebraccatus]|uniref:uncharacterized protein n=1 Tax=Dendropsophus ebraccatus TaxID=150705 RepID=UPI00383158B3
MKLILLWVCLISEALALPTQTPADYAKDCCGENPKLIYKGHNSNKGINVYVYEFLPGGKEAKEDTTIKNGLQSDRNHLKGKENGENYEDTMIPTKRPVSLYGKKLAPDTETPGDTTHMPDLKFDTITSTVGAAQNDVTMYEDTDLLSNATERLPKGMSHARDTQKMSGDSNGNDYYGTEGSALPDLPGYTDTDTGNRSSNVDFPPNVNDLGDTGCTESEGQCKYKEHFFVTQPTVHKDHSDTSRHGPDKSATREGKTMDDTTKWRIKPTNAARHKKKRKSDPSVNRKDIPKRANTGKMIQYHRGQRRKMGGNRYRYSSSESGSESSQEFD